ncbi:MAG: hypothetical protein AAFU79_05455 [Myxococcota bacterium]
MDPISPTPILTASRALGLALVAVVALACDEDRLFIVPDPPDTGIEDTGFTDLGSPDFGLPDLGPPDLGAPATEPIYIHTGDTLYSYDPVAHRATWIGRFETLGGELIEPMVDVAIDARGVMYGGSGASRDPKRVFRIDPGTGRCTFLFEVDDNLNGMAFDGLGRLVAAGETLRVLDPSTGRTVVTFEDAGSRFTTSGDVVGLPDGNLYWTVRGEADGEADRLVRLDPSTGRPALLGSLGVDRLFGLGYAQGELFGFTPSGEVVVIDPASGRVLEARSLEGRWFGATANPVLW